MVRGDDVQPGDEVITSGVGGVAPEGPPHRRGRRGRTPTRRSCCHTATLQPAVDFGRLEQVFVMLHRGPTMDLLYGGDGDLPTDAAPAPAAAAQAVIGRVEAALP